MMNKGLKSWGLLVGLIVAGLLALSLTLLASAWLFNRASEAANRHREVKALIKEAPAADSLLREYKRLDSTLSGLGQGLTPGQEGSDALRILGERAKHVGLQVTGIKALEEKQSPAYKELPFEVRAQGDFSQVHGFLKGLDSLGLLMRLHVMSLKAKAMHRPELEAVLELSIFSAGKAP